MCFYHVYKMIVFAVFSIRCKKCLFFLGSAGVSKAQTIVKEVIDTFHNIEFPDKKPSGQ